MTITITSTSAASQANTYTNDQQKYPAAAALTGGGYVVSWISVGQDGSGEGVYFQRYDANGAKVGSETRANTGISGDQNNQMVTALSTGGFVVSWTGSGPASYAQRYDASGNPVGGEFQLNATGFSDFPAVGAINGGGFVGGWLASLPGQPFTLQRFDAAGNRVGAEFPIVQPNKLITNAVITGLPDGGFLVTWEARDSQYSTAEALDIYSQRFDANGTAVSAVGQVNTYNLMYQDAASVAVLADGGWVITWESSNQDSDNSSGVYFQRYNAAGVKVGGETRANTTVAGTQDGPTVAALTTGGFVVTWADRSNESVKAQVYNAVGAAVGGEVTVSNGDHNSFPSVVAMANGGYAVSWMTYADNGSTYLDIKTRTFSSPAVASALTTAVDSAAGDSAADVLTMTPTTLNQGDAFNGGSGNDTLKATVAGTYDFTGVTLTSVETILGSSGDDTFFFPNPPPAGMLFDSGGGHDTLVTASSVSLDSIEATGDWTLAAQAGSTVTFTVTDAEQVPYIEAHGAHVTVDATSVTLTAEDRFILFNNGVELINQAGGLTFTADGIAHKSGAIAQVSSTSDNGMAGVAALAGGGYVLTWQAWSDGVPADVHARIFNNAGVAVSSDITVNTVTAGYQGQPSVAALGGGGFVVVWQSDNATLIRAQRFDASGAKVGSEFDVGSLPSLVATQPAANAGHADVTALDGGGFAVAWVAYQPNGYCSVYVDLYNASGVHVGSQVQANSDTPYYHESPSISALPGGGFAVTWTTTNQSYQSVFDSAGQRIGSQSTVTASSNIAFVNVAGLNDGTYVVSWSQADNSQSPFTHVYAQRYHADGTTFGSAFLVADNGGDSMIGGPPVATADGGYIITWRDHSNTDFSTRIYGQRYDVSGNTVGDRMVISTADLDTEPVVAQTTSGALVFAWTTSTNFNADTQINQRVLTPLDYQLLTSGSDTVAGTALDTLIVGAPGDINAGDNLTGGTGTDRLELTASGSVNLSALAGFSGFEEIVGASGDDTLIVGSSTLAGVTSIDGRTGRDVIQLGSAGTLNLTGMTLSGIEQIAGTSGVDTITGTAGNDVIAGLGGADVINGAGGSDTADYAASGSAVTVNLTTGTNTGGDAAGDTLTSIENLTGSAFNDSLTGDANANVLDGGAGNDTLDGQGGADTASYASAANGVTVSLSIAGAQNTVGAGSDTLVNIENLTGSAFNDTLSGNAGANVLDGGDGFDTASYANAASAVQVSLSFVGAQNTVGAGTDTLTGFEALTGSAFNDILTGDAGANVLNGGDGNDTLDGRAGDDSLIGGNGIDAANYSSATGAVTVSLAIAGAQNTGAAGVDTLSGIENLIGSGFNDTLTGDAGDNVLIGGLGNDTLDGGAGADTAGYAIASAAVSVSLAISGPQNTVGAGIDTLVNIENLTGSAFDDVLSGNAGTNIINGGSGGIDAVDYRASTSGVTVSLATAGQQNTGGGGLDTLISIENAYGSAFDDTLEGDGGANYLNAGAGNDTLSYASAAGGVTINLASDQQQVTGGAGTDTVLGFENVTGSAFNDTLIGTSGANVFNGGAGIDLVSYAGASGGVSVNLATASAQNTGAGGVDTLISIENLIGTGFNDTLAGNGGDNVLDGGQGVDTISYAGATAGVTVNLNLTGPQNTGGAGTDTLLNFESIVGSAFNDVITLSNTTANTANAGAGNDTIVLHNGGTVTGGAGQDAYLIDWNSGFPGGRTALTITDFRAGAGGDRLDLSDFLANADWDGASDPFEQGYLQLVQSGMTVTLKVDADGGGDTFTDLVVLQNVDGSSLVAANLSGLLVGPVIIDAPGNTGTNINLAIGQSIAGAISPGNDTDWFRVELTAGQSYLFTVNGTGGLALADPIVRVHDANGGLITFDDDGGPGLDAAVRFTPTTSGTYYIEADSYDDVPGAYTVGAQAVAPQNPLNTIDLGFKLPSSTVAIYFAPIGESYNGHTADRSWSTSEIYAAMQAWSSFSTSVNLNFVQVSSAAAATVVAILDDLPDDLIGLAESGGGGTAASITFDPAAPFWSASAINVGGIAYETMIHEMGHILGLAHPHDDGGDSEVMEGVTSEFDSYGVAQLNQGVFTVMSYNDGWPSQNSGPSGYSTGYDETPMALDIALLQQKYGARANNTGDTAYDFGLATTASGFSTIWDTGGVDTIAYNGTSSVHIDLRPATLLNQAGGGGYVTYVGSGLGGYTIAAGVQIENATGGSGADVLIGNDLSNVLTGLAGPDIFTGGGGADVFLDLATNHIGDTITDFSAGDQIVFAGASLAGFSFALAGSLLTFTGGTMTLSGLAAGSRLVASSVAQGVALSLGNNVLNNGLSGDFNGDGKDDLLWRSDSGQLSNWLGQTNGGFVGNDANAFVSVPTSWKVIGAGDFNGDGREDILWRSDTGQMSNWLGTASGGWLGNDANAFVNVPNDWKIAGVGDFNGDGKSDLLWRSDSGLMSDWLGTASGGWAANDANTFTSVPTNWHIIGVGDFNGDHRDDILWRSDTGQMSNWLGQANGGFVGNDANAFVNVPTDWHIVGVGDFNGDGKSDLLWRSDSGLMSNWLGQANGGWAPNDANALTSVPTDWVIAAVGDYNGDGKDDIMWRHTSGAMSNWLGQANGGFTGNDANAYAVVGNSWHIQADNMFGI